MSASFNPNKGFQGDNFQSGCSVCRSMDLNKYYGSQKGGVPKKPAKKSSSSKKPTKKPAKKSTSTKKPAKKPAKKSSSTKKRGGSDTFDEFDKINSSLTWATQAGGTELASEYYTSAQQGSYAPYNASKDAKCGGGRKKRVVRGGIGMGQAEGIMNQKKGNMDGSMSAADSATKGGGCGCAYKPKTSGAKRGGSDGYYTDTLTGSDPVVETEDVLEDGNLNGGAKKKRSSSKGAKKPAKAKPKSSSSKGAKKKPRKLRGGDDSAGGGSDFATTHASWGPVNTTSMTDKAYFPIFNKSTPYMSKQDLIYCGVAPESTGCIPPSDGPRAYNDDFIGGKKKPAKKSASSKSKAKPAKKSTSSKSKAKKH
jgi:hypothetical protein